MGTIASNIAFGHAMVTWDDIGHAARLTNCEFVWGMPKGFDTKSACRWDTHVIWHAHLPQLFEEPTVVHLRTAPWIMYKARCIYGGEISLTKQHWRDTAEHHKHQRWQEIKCGTDYNGTWAIAWPTSKHMHVWHETQWLPRAHPRDSVWHYHIHWSTTAYIHVARLTTHLLPIMLESTQHVALTFFQQTWPLDGVWLCRCICGAEQRSVDLSAWECQTWSMMVCEGEKMTRTYQMCAWGTLGLHCKLHRW